MKNLIMKIEEENRCISHNGHAIKRLRNALRIKQDVLANTIGISQTQVSFYEQQRVICEDMLKKFAEALNVSPCLIKELKEDPITFIIENKTFEKKSPKNIPYYSHSESLINIENFLKLCKKRQKLYEYLLKSEEERIKFLEKTLDINE